MMHVKKRSTLFNTFVWMASKRRGKRRLNFIKYSLKVDAALEWGLIGKFRLLKIEKINNSSVHTQKSIFI